MFNGLFGRFMFNESIKIKESSSSIIASGENSLSPEVMIGNNTDLQVTVNINAQGNVIFISDSNVLLSNSIVNMNGNVCLSLDQNIQSIVLVSATPLRKVFQNTNILGNVSLDLTGNFVVVVQEQLKTVINVVSTPYLFRWILAQIPKTVWNDTTENKDIWVEIRHPNTLWKGVIQ